MKPTSKNRKSRSLFRLDQPPCALPPNKVLVPDPESLPSVTILYFHQPSANAGAGLTPVLDTDYTTPGQLSFIQQLVNRLVISLVYGGSPL